MAFMTRWLAPAVVAAGLGMAAMAPATAQAEHRDDDLVRVIVDIADVMFRSGHPYYRHGGYGYNDRLIVSYDRYGRPIYHRYAPRTVYRNGPPYGNAYGYGRNGPGHRVTKCNRHGKCKVYYDNRYDRRYYDNRYYRYDDRYSRDYRRDRYWDGYRWRDRDYDD